METGRTKWSGTDEEVRIQLDGDCGQTDQMTLGASAAVNPTSPGSREEEFFSVGSVEEFRFSANFVGSNLAKIRVSHGNSGNPVA